MTVALTLAEAQALQCNGCGDCCDSRAAAPHNWHWGNAPDLYREFNGGEPLIIPLRVWTMDGGYEQAPPGSANRVGRPTFVGPFTCTALLPENEEGQRLCALYEAPRPAICGSFPVWGGHGEQIAAELAGGAASVPVQTACLPRCTWYDTVIVPEDGERRNDAPTPYNAA